ncbi:hypothetical protein ABBQ32_008569 [Trebouxia sp. C0010 RCD-2024]
MCLSVRVTDAAIALTSLLLLEKSESVFAAKQLGPQDLSALTVLSTAAAQQEDLFDCLASFSKPTQVKTELLHRICKDALAVLQRQKGRRIQHTDVYLRVAARVAKAVQDAVETRSASSCYMQVIQGKDVPANVREETNQFTQNLYKSAPADFWESLMDDIEAIKATTNVVLVKYATNSAI